jgi:16S rRNA (cytidine1402-2'-O)-methyltransferase
MQVAMTSYLLHGAKIPAAKPPCGLYIVATPIGNLKDITIRALETLAGCDVIACEDTRHSGKLLAAYGIKNTLLSYHDHNGEAMRPVILAKLREGQAIALISDAGTPLIADPGFKLVREIASEGFQVFPIAGASALTSALSAAGLPTDSFLFDGFLPPKQAARIARLEVLKPLKATLVFYETAGRIHDVLADIQAVLGNREAVLAREITKMHEEFRRGTVEELLNNEVDPRGELVLMIAASNVEELDEAAIDDKLREALKNSSLKEAAAIVSIATGVSKRTLYQRALDLK